MIDPRLLKDNPDSIREMLKKRQMIDTFRFEELVTLDKRRRELTVESQELKHTKNVLSEAIANKKKSNQDASEELEKMKGLNEHLVKTEQERISVDENFRNLLMLVPNMLDESVPVGIDERDNVVLTEKPPPNKGDSGKQIDHVDIATSLDLLDLERAAKISGARFYFLKNGLVMLNQAILNFALDYLSDNGYTPIQPPFMIRKEAIQGAVILGDFADVIYKIDNEDLHLIGTSEHALASMHMNEIMEGSKLPTRYAGISTCFRKEAGAHGKDMKGIFRVHQFEKVEQFVFARPDESIKEHERMLSISQKFYEIMGLPFRVVLLCSGDTGKVSAKTYDIEVWMPGQGAYREIVSCSNCFDYQARGLGIRFRDRTNEETRYVHTLNSTLVATQRTMVAIMENYQADQGKSIEVPEALQKYMGGMKKITRTKM